METRPFGKTNMRVSALGFGGAEIGFENAKIEEVSRLLNTALDAGLNVIDTAECYIGNGTSSEDLIGRAVSHRRKDFFLFTKCGHAAGLPEPEWSRALLEKSIARSLQRLRTDHLDLLQLHSCSEQTLRAGEVIEALQNAKTSGKTRFIGYSGDGRAALYAVECGAFDSLQTSCNIADQESIERTIPEARKRGMGVIAKRPIANAAWKTGRKPDNPYAWPYWERLQKLQYDFLEKNPEQALSIALRFTLAVEGVCTVIVGTKNLDHWRSNAEVLTHGPLPREQFDAIRSRWKQIAHPDWQGQT